MADTQAAARKTRPSLFGAVETPQPEPQAAPAAHPAPKIPARRSGARGRQDRQDKRQIAGFFSPECAKQLRMLAAEADTTVQDLLREGLNLMFREHGKPPIA